MPDIDIDFANRDVILEKLRHRVAKLNETKKHNTGVYFTEIPSNPVTNISTIDYKTADKRGYFKLDFLNVSLYKNIRNEDHLNTLIAKEPIWSLLEHTDFVEQLFHVGDHGSILEKMKPQSVEELAMVLAIIRPGKRHLLGKTWNDMKETIWKKPTNNEYYFKKAHAIAYAMAIVVQMNLLCEELNEEKVKRPG
jgi:DNA polymerase III alpha subunit|tara:strand:+ start:703 stop:1284 length:582 start_codon:yes stop_codon:yes gene_type:complete